MCFSGLIRKKKTPGIIQDNLPSGVMLRFTLLGWYYCVLKAKIHFCFIKQNKLHPNLDILGVKSLLYGISVCLEKLNF